MQRMSCVATRDIKRISERVKEATDSYHLANVVRCVFTAVPDSFYIVCCTM
jgi:hypothetical protein